MKASIAKTGVATISGADTISAANASRSARKSHVPDGQKPDRWHIVADPPLTPNQLHCATVPDGSDCQWKGAEYERLEAKNRTALKAAEQAEIEANGEFTEPEWREVTAQTASDASSRDIPDFLKREPAAVSETTESFLIAAE